jgi:hypothetical protein
LSSLPLGGVATSSFSFFYGFKLKLSSPVKSPNALYAISGAASKVFLGSFKTSLIF